MEYIITAIILIFLISFFIGSIPGINNRNRYYKCPGGFLEQDCIYPYYGLAPHKHNMQKTGSIIGSTEIDEKDTWPDNFKEDPESPGCGVYYCPFNERCKN